MTKVSVVAELWGKYIHKMTRKTDAEYQKFLANSIATSHRNGSPKSSTISSGVMLLNTLVIFSHCIRNTRSLAMVMLIG